MRLLGEERWILILGDHGHETLTVRRDVEREVALPARNQRAPSRIPHDPLRGGPQRGGFTLLAAASPWLSRVTPPLPPTAETVEPEKRVCKSEISPLRPNSSNIRLPWTSSLAPVARALEATRRGEEPSQQREARPWAVARYLAAAGELTEGPGPSPPRAPPYGRSQVLKATGAR